MIRHLQIAQQTLKRPLLGIVVFPLGEITDMAGAANICGPRLVGHQHPIIQPEGKQYNLAALVFFLKGFRYLILDPDAVKRIDVPQLALKTFQEADLKPDNGHNSAKLSSI